MQLTDFDIDDFLRDYWQKKPLLIRNPWKAWKNPVERDVLAGLSCEEDVESRLVTGTDKRWQVENGPIAETRFAELGEEHWTLLVQAVDHYVPEVAGLVNPFRFIPNWRIDDVMVSYATDGGGVGPHFDQYDVFLIQGLGKRRWQTGVHCSDDTELLPHENLRLLANFEAQEEWICESGDILYIPPGVAHNGVAVGDDSMTYSIGFRAPSRSDLMGHWVDDLLAEMKDDDRYTDSDLAVQENPGEISAHAIDQLHDMIVEKIGDRQDFAQWFGRYNSTPKYPDMDWRPDQPVKPEDIKAKLKDGQCLCRNPAGRFSFMRGQGDVISLFVDGQSFECTGPAAALAEQICQQYRITTEPGFYSDEALLLIAALCNQGSLTIDSD